MALKGIDVSKHQGTIDWTKLKGKIDFAILRAGYGKLTSKKDTQFESNYKGCKNNNIPVGCYWYSYAKSEAEAVKEAETCLSVIKGKQFEYPIFFDIEENSTLLLGKSTVTKITKAFCEKIESSGYWVGLYSSKSALESYIDEATRKRYSVWVAHVNVSKTTYSGDYAMWQYSWKGSFDGINGDVDMDYCYVDFPTSIKKQGLNGFTASTTKTTTTSSTTASTKAKSTTTTIKKGTKVVLKNTNIYASATSTKSAGKKTGNFYVYDTTIKNNRIRITNTVINVGKTPASQYVTGWINVSDVK